MKRIIYTGISALVIGAFILPLVLAILATPAHASCIGNWPGQQSDPSARIQQREHKALHLLGSAAVTAAVGWAADDVRLGMAAGVALGLAREIQKATTPGMRCEWSSMAYDAMGIALGAYGASRWLIVPHRGGVQIAWSRRF